MMFRISVVITLTLFAGVQGQTTNDVYDYIPKSTLGTNIIYPYEQYNTGFFASPSGLLQYLQEDDPPVDVPSNTQNPSFSEYPPDKPSYPQPHPSYPQPQPSYPQPQPYYPQFTSSSQYTPSVPYNPQAQQPSNIQYASPSQNAYYPQTAPYSSNPNYPQAVSPPQYAYNPQISTPSQYQQSPTTSPYLSTPSTQPSAIASYIISQCSSPSILSAYSASYAETEPAFKAAFVNCVFESLAAYAQANGYTASGTQAPSSPNTGSQGNAAYSNQGSTGYAPSNAYTTATLNLNIAPPSQAQTVYNSPTTPYVATNAPSYVASYPTVTAKPSPSQSQAVYNSPATPYVASYPTATIKPNPSSPSQIQALYNSPATPYVATSVSGYAPAVTVKPNSPSPNYVPSSYQNVPTTVKPYPQSPSQSQNVYNNLATPYNGATYPASTTKPSYIPSSYQPIKASQQQPPAVYAYQPAVSRSSYPGYYSSNSYERYR
uniref:Uncharacterized protein n=1 Tax=Biomphalaria glabrata TaxID=6526 RepID=A0A2C9KI24_BIOGL